MKFVVSVVNKVDSHGLVDLLVSRGYRLTTWNTTGGFLGKENLTLFTAVEDDRVADVVALIQENCHTRVQQVGSLPPVMESGELYVLDTKEVQVGGAVIFVFDVEQFFKA